MTAYTAVPLEKLDYIRLTLRAKLKQLEASTGESYAIRTFYIGPRAYRARTTNKAQAKCAKIGIYKVTTKQYRPDYVMKVLDLQRYI